MSGLGSTFVSESVEYLTRTYPDRLAAAVEALPPDDLWWRPHPGVLSVGTILRHLEGNVRQWILSGLGNRPDDRNRAAEFEAPPGEDASTLLDRLRLTVGEAGEVIRGMSEQDLSRRFQIQGNRPTGMQAIYHVVEHFSWHTGQAVWIAKARAGQEHGIAFFDEARINAARNRQAREPGARSADRSPGMR